MIPFFDYRPQLGELRPQIESAMRRVLDSGRLILGPEVEAFENEFARWVGAGGAVGVASGTDAVTLGLRASGVEPGDEVITVANAGAPPVVAIRNAGAVPRFADVDRRTLLIDSDSVRALIRARTRAVLVVHLYGCPAPLEPLLALTERHGLALVEDCAQAHGAHDGTRHVGTRGRVGCFSFYPTKNLGALGDGGACVSSDADVLDRLRRLRQYGYSGSSRSSGIEGTNSRLDELQAAILRVKLTAIDRALETRQTIARRYLRGLDGASFELPTLPVSGRHAFHLFVVRSSRRQDVIAELERSAIGHGIHYPDPVHLMPAFESRACPPGSLPWTEEACRSVFSLPLFPGLSAAAVDQVVDVLSGLGRP